MGINPINLKPDTSITHCVYSGRTEIESDFTYHYLINQMFLGKPISISGIANSVMINHVSVECNFDEKKIMVFQVIMKGTTL